MAVKGAVLGDILGSQYEFHRPNNLGWQNVPPGKSEECRIYRRFSNDTCYQEKSG